MSWLPQAYRSSLVACAAVAFATSRLPAETSPTPADFIVREWHVDDGLPQEDVLQLLQDRHGYLWVATRGGLVRFDGTTFLRPPGANRDGYIGLFERADGTLLAVPRTGDPVALRHGIFEREPLPAPYTGQTIGGGIVAPDGACWFTLKGATLRLSSAGVQAFSAADGIGGRLWTWFATDGQGRVWLANEAALARYEPGGLVHVSLPAAGSEIRIASSHQGGPWVITATQALKLDERDQVHEVAKIAPLISAHYVSAAVEDRNGVLWLGTRSQGVHAIAAGRDIHVPTSHDAIFSLAADAEGTLWVGTNIGGLNAISPKIYRLFNKASGLIETVTTSVCEDTTGTMWFADGDGGIARLRGNELVSKLARYQSRLFGALSVSPHPAGGIWVAGSPGLFRAADLEQIESVAEVPSAGVRRLTFTAQNGDLWMSVDPDRVGRLRQGTFTAFGSAEGFDGREVRAFAEDRLGNIWIGTTDGRLLRFDGKAFHPVPIPTSTALGAVNAIHLAEDGLWLATARAGIAVLVGSNVTFIGPEQGLPDDNITQIVADDLGNLWCGSGRGVFRLRQSDVQRFLRHETRWVTPLVLGKDEALRSLTCAALYGPAAMKSHDGQIWFATHQGVLAIDPRAQTLDPRPPIVAIEEVRCDDKPQPLANLVTIPAGTRKLEIVVSVLCLSAPNRVQARYRLDGFDDDWVLAGRDHIATYPRLPPGRYPFTVHAGFGDPVSDQPMASLVVVVLPQWWQTRLFQVAALLGFVTAITAIVRVWSHRRLRRRIEKLERETAVARERARIAENIHDDVGASLTRISLLTQAASPNSPNAANLDRIYETAREITRSLDEIVWAVNPQYDTLESFIAYLTDFAQNFLGVAGVRCRLDISPTLPAISLSSDVRHHLFLCCREALNNVVKHAGASEAFVRLSYTASILTIVIADNGRGLMADSSSPSPDRVSSGHGLSNLRQRMQRLGGKCLVESPVNGGTAVTLTVNVESSAPLPS